MAILRPIVDLLFRRRPPTPGPSDRTPMPLTPPVPRERLHTRNIVCDGYRRGDGLFDIEARLVEIGRAHV